MKTRLEALGAARFVYAEGRLDFGSAAGLQRELEAALAAAGKPPAALVLDCSALDYVSSAGLRVLLQTARAAQRARVGFALCALAPAVREVFDLSGFSRLIEVHPDRAAALAHAGRAGALPLLHRDSPAEAAQLPELMRSLQHAWTAAGLPAAQAQSFELALEEAFMNVVMHGSQGGCVPRVEVSLSVTAGGLTLTLEDGGPEFDPLSLPPPDVTSGVAERRIGGYGVHLLRQMMETVSYRRIGGRNQLTMCRQISP